jgi:hypothetical protein
MAASELDIVEAFSSFPRCGGYWIHDDVFRVNHRKPILTFSHQHRGMTLTILAAGQL